MSLIGASLISAGGSLLGGLLGNSGGKTVSSRRQVRQSIEGAAQGARFFSDEYGFNPLTLLGVAGVTPTQVIPGNNYMGSAIADAGMALADGMARKAISDKESQLERENRELRERVQQMTIRPQIGGVYARRAATPTLRQAVGGANGSAAGGSGVAVSGAGSDGVSGAHRPIATTAVDDPRREVNVEDVPSDGGIIVIDNPKLSRPFTVPGVGGEPLDASQAAIVGGSYLFDRFWRQPAEAQAAAQERLGQIDYSVPAIDGGMTFQGYNARPKSRPEIDGGIYLRSPSVPPPARPTRTYKPPAKSTPMPRVWDY